MRNRTRADCWEDGGGGWQLQQGEGVLERRTASFCMSITVCVWYERERERGVKGMF